MLQLLEDVNDCEANGGADGVITCQSTGRCLLTQMRNSGKARAKEALVGQLVAFTASFTTSNTAATTP